MYVKFTETEVQHVLDAMDFYYEDAELNNAVDLIDESHDSIMCKLGGKLTFNIHQVELIMRLDEMASQSNSRTSNWQSIDIASSCLEMLLKAYPSLNRVLVAVQGASSGERLGHNKKKTAEQILNELGGNDNVM